MRSIKLFDKLSRRDQGPRPYALPDFIYLNTSARPGVEAIRNELARWFSNYPKAERSELRARFRSDNIAHRSAYFELFLHELLIKLGCKVKVHPKIIGTTRRPDFSAISENASRFYLEAVLATDQTKEEMAAEARSNQVYDALNKLDSPDFYIGMYLRGAPAKSPSARSMRSFLTKYLIQLNRDEIRVAFEQGGIPALPHWRYEQDGWRIDFFPIPKSDNARGKVGVRPIGILFEGSRWLQTKVAIRNAILEKAGRYGQLLSPYIIAVNVLSDHVDETDMIEALFGDEHLVYTNQMSLSQEPQLQRAANGAWNGPAGPQNTRVSGVLIFERLSQSNVPWLTPCLYLNPWAANPYSGPLDGLRRGVVADNRMKYIDGQTLTTLFGLSTNWPGE
jgi:hypothetical protein